MADYLVSALVKTIVGTLNSASLQEIGLLWGLKDELNSLESTFTTLQLVLEDAEIKQRKNEAIKNWLRKLKNAAYDVEDILDDMAIESHKVREKDSWRGKSFLSLRPLTFKFKMAHKVKNIRKKLSAIAEERLQFHLGGTMENRYGVTVESRRTSSLVNESEIYGRDEEREMILGKLLDSAPSQDDICVFAMCGMGGIGKTTLAQMVYNDERIEKHFELRIWVCISDDFDIQRIVRAILESIDGHKCNIVELDPLQRLLRERLRGKRFLIVLDDVWNENHRLWDGLKEILTCGSEGNVLVATTRIEKVASMMATIDVHHIECLTEEDSWSLFKKRAFLNRRAEENLVEIGKAIVKKCGGVPLAIKALGSLMRFKSSEIEWLAIKENEIWHSSNDENGIVAILRLSYDNLLPHMRQCFAYCCLYPKDYVMQEHDLIQLWMANGFISSQGQRDLYLAGQLIFQELNSRSFFQDIRIHETGERTCKMHDLMHDLAVSVMTHEIYILEDGMAQEIPKTVRHLSISMDVTELKLQNDGSLRTLINSGSSFHRDMSSSVSVLQNKFCSLLLNQQYIRALMMHHFVIENWPSIVCKLKHLTYLCMTCYDMKKLPGSLTNLHNLQTLKLSNCGHLLKLPKNLKVMKNLWFLEMDNPHRHFYTPPGLGELTNLRRLSFFIVGEAATQQIDQLKELNLGGDLTIKGLNNVKNLREAQSANLMAKKNLMCLELHWDYDKEISLEHSEEVLRGLQPHENLRRISIFGYRGSKFSNWWSTLAFEKLEKIWLHCCPECEYLPPLGKLPSLRFISLQTVKSVKCLSAEWHGDAECSFPTLTKLHISDMPNLNEWSIPKCSFPALTQLRISSMPNLEEWSIPKCSFLALTTLNISNMPNLEEWSIPNSVDCLPCLTYLHIRQCPKLDRLPFLPSLETLSTYATNNEALTSSITCLTSLKSLSIYDYTEVDFLLPKPSIQKDFSPWKVWELVGRILGSN